MKIHKPILNNRLNSLKRLPVDKTFLATNKDNLMETIYNDPLVHKGEQMRSVQQTKLSFRLKTIPIASLIILIVAGSGTAMASQNSLPSDILYPVKLMTENIKEDLTFDTIKRAELRMEHAQKRIAEITSIEKANPKVLKDEKVMASVLNNYDQKIRASVSEVYKTPSHRLTTKLRYANIDNELTKNKATLNQIQEGSKETENTAIKSTIAEIEAKQKEYIDIVSNKAKDDSVAAEEVKEIIDNKLRYWEEKVADNYSKNKEDDMIIGSAENYTNIRTETETQLDQQANDKIKTYREIIKTTDNTNESLPAIQEEIIDWERKVIEVEMEIKKYRENYLRDDSNEESYDQYQTPILKEKLNTIIESKNDQSLEEENEEATDEDILEKKKSTTYR
ncbi:MAG: DUF5667 domain-containing protein [Candidatus Komeilibacteria bacterium]